MSFQAYLDNIEAKTGRNPDQFRQWGEGQGLFHRHRTGARREGGRHRGSAEGRLRSWPWPRHGDRRAFEGRETGREEAMKATAYLFFAGDCAEALQFYRDAIGADIRALVRFGDMPGAPSDAQDKVMHAELGIGDSTIFASDGQAIDRSSGGYAISLLAADDAEAERLFAALATEGRFPCHS
jgi:PhnB protein